jgi:transposase
MPRPHPPEFRKRAIELARLREKPIAQIAADLGISESCLRSWVHQADVDEGKKEGLSTDERAELVRLRRELRVKDMEIEILKRASAYFASGSEQANGTTLPWTKTVSGKGLITIFSVDAQLQSGNTVTCTLTVDGKVVSTHTSTGQYAVVSCSGSN